MIVDRLIMESSRMGMKVNIDKTDVQILEYISKYWEEENSWIMWKAAYLGRKMNAEWTSVSDV